MAETTMVGGTTSGYSLMGSLNIEIKPTRKMRVEITPAKIGRRMKKFEKFIRLPFVLETKIPYWVLIRVSANGLSLSRWLDVNVSRVAKFPLCWRRRIRL